jgi:hypothetical protein
LLIPLTLFHAKAELSRLTDELKQLKASSQAPTASAEIAARDQALADARLALERSEAALREKQAQLDAAVQQHQQALQHAQASAATSAEAAAAQEQLAKAQAELKEVLCSSFSLGLYLSYEFFWDAVSKARSRFERAVPAEETDLYASAHQTQGPDCYFRSSFFCWSLTVSLLFLKGCSGAEGRQIGRADGCADSADNCTD